METLSILKNMLENKSEIESSGISEPLKIAYSKILLNSSLEIDPENVKKHPRIIKCIDLIESGLNKLPFHGYNSLESINKIFCEHFLSQSDDYYEIIVEQLLKIEKTNQLYLGIGKVGHILDEQNHGGSRLIRAACLARAAVVDESIFRSEINKAVQAFKNISTFCNGEEIVFNYKNKWVTEKKSIPSFYHIQLLAYSNIWRTEDNQKLVINGLNKLLSFRLPEFLIKYKSQLIAPASLDLKNLFEPKHDFKILRSFELIKYFLLIGYDDKEFSDKTKKFLNNFDVSLIKKSYYFLNWGAYTGLGLEPNWRSRKRKILDLFFRVKEIEGLV